MISIIIPAFREADRIGATVSAVLRAAEELEEPAEILVVDDGSDDATAERAGEGDPGVQADDAEFPGRERPVCPGESRLKPAGSPEPVSGTKGPSGPLPDDRRVVHGPGTRRAGPEHLNARTPEHPTPSLRVLRLERNHGKGAALARGLAEARGELIVMLDADLGATAAEFPRLLAPVLAGEADMTIAVFGGVRRQASGVSVPTSPRRPVAPSPPHASKSGFGLALRTARWGVARLTGRVLEAPLSGQRALRAAHLPLLTPLEPGFGLEVGLDIDALRAGLRLLEVPTTMAHAATGRDWAGFRHRGRQLLHILRALARRSAFRSVESPGRRRGGMGV